MGKLIGNMGNLNCNKCGKPFTYIGDVIEGAEKPFCTCNHGGNAEIGQYGIWNPPHKWAYCPHCGKELK